MGSGQGVLEAMGLTIKLPEKNAWVRREWSMDLREVPTFPRKGRPTKELGQSWAKKKLREKICKNPGVKESVQFHTEVEKLLT